MNIKYSHRANNRIHIIQVHRETTKDLVDLQKRHNGFMIIKISL